MSEKEKRAYFVRYNKDVCSYDELKQDITTQVYDKTVFRNHSKNRNFFTIELPASKVPALESLEGILGVEGLIEHHTSKKNT